MNDYNQFGFIGRLVRDSEIKYTKNGSPVVEFSVAVNEKYGEKEMVSFFDVILWGNLGVALEKYLVKGQQILVSGRIRQDRWQHEGKNYNKIRFIAKDVQLVGGKEKIEKTSQSFDDPYLENNDTQNIDEDIPF